MKANPTLSKTGGNVTFKLSATTSVFIVGDMGFCSGQSVSLTTYTVNGTGTPSYSWTPGSYTTAVITVSPTVTTTYTLTYTDGNGTYTATATTYTLPAAACASCNFVQNGSFESYVQQCNNIGNVGFYNMSCTGNFGSDPKYWYAPTCGSSDVYHSQFTGGVDVPINAFSSFSGTPANSGNGYGGFYAVTQSCCSREYLQEPLKCALNAGQMYNVSFYTRPGKDCQYTCNNIGMYISTTAINSTTITPLSSYTPQINSGAVSTNTVWTSVSGTYTASGGEQYITLGNFYDDNNTSTTLTYTAGTKNTAYYYVDDITITPVTPTLSASTATVNCASANTITLTATGAPSGTLTVWTGGFGSPHYGSPCVVPTPTATTTYTCSVTSCTGCTPITQTITITGNGPPTVSVTPVSPYVCYGPTSTTLTASGASSYTWAPSSTLSCSVCATTVATPTATTTYTITASTGTCTATQTVSVALTLFSCTGNTVATSVSTSGSFTNTPGFVTADVTINNPASYTISSSEMRFAPGTKITVKSGATLVVDASWLHACGTCSASMWQGIACETGGQVIVKNYSIIEDASVAGIKTQSSGTVVATPTVNITDAIFNQNSKGLYFDSELAATTCNYSVSNTIFTCRSFSVHTCNSSNFGNIKADITAATPLLTSTVNPTAKMLNGVRSAYGIYAYEAVTNTLSIPIGSSSGTYTAITNVFDNLDYGIYGYQVSLHAKNNRFQNCTGKEPFLGFPPVATGSGIYVENNSTEGANVTLIVGNSTSTVNNSEKNNFLNCMRGVWSKNFRFVKINNNFFDVETTATNFVSAGNVSGEYGIYNATFGKGASSGSKELFLMSNNVIQNYQRGLFHDFAKVYGTAQSSSITTNTITSGGTASKYCFYGIYMQQGTSNGANTGVPQNAVDLTANTITLVDKNCINALSINTSTATSGFVTIHENTDLAIKYNSSATSSTITPKQAAVIVNGCYYVKVNDNSSVRSDHSGSYGSGDAQYQTGIYIKQSPNSTVICNTVSNIGECFTWDGASAGSTWKQNTMSSGRYGLVLRSSGILGDQGSSGHSIMNVWSNGGIVSFQTLCDASDPSTGTTSKLYTSAPTCTTTNTYQPCSNTVTTGAAYASGATLLTTSSDGTNLCVQGGGGGDDRLIDQVASGEENLDSLISNNATFPVFSDETRWMMQYYISSKDTSISAISGCVNAKKMAVVDGLVSAGRYEDAQALNNSINASSTIEENWVDLNTILISNAIDSTEIDSNDAIVVKAIAEQCPLSGGSIVFRARAIYNTYIGAPVEYVDNCTEGGEEKGTSVNASLIVEENYFHLYPNPNAGKMVLEFRTKKDCHLEISEINGTLVGRYRMSSSVNRLEINNDELTNGVYLFRIISDNVTLKVGKIVILK